jgi:hypothetical protein
MIWRDVQCFGPSPYGAAGIVLATRLFARALQTLPREARSPGRTWKERGGASVSLFATPVSPKPKSKRKKLKEAERRQTQGHNRRILRCGARSFGARTLDGVPPRLSPKGIIPSQRLSFRPGFLGRGLNGRYPPSPVPVQGSTSHPGPNAGRHDAQAAREQAANPPAGTALAPMTRCASVPCPSPERGLLCNWNKDECQEGVSGKVTVSAVG